MNAYAIRTDFALTKNLGRPLLVVLGKGIKTVYFDVMKCQN